MSAEHSLDELAKGLASGSVSRRKALRLMGGVLAATVLGSVPGIALTQRAAEAALRSCQNASACCYCNYYTTFGGAFISGTCETEVGRRCSGRRIQSFLSECASRCEENFPEGAGAALFDSDCEEEPNQRNVCRQRATGERFCKLRSC